MWESLLASFPFRQRQLARLMSNGEVELSTIRTEASAVSNLLMTRLASRTSIKLDVAVSLTILSIVAHHRSAGVGDSTVVGLCRLHVRLFPM
jgi:hypothetical protein